MAALSSEQRFRFLKEAERILLAQKNFVKNRVDLRSVIGDCLLIAMCLNNSQSNVT